MQKIYDRQVEFQKQMNTNYDTMYLALVGELGELVDSFGFADWKKIKRDEENIIVECMDIAIFAMNCHHYSKVRYSDFDNFDDNLSIYSDTGFIQEIVRLLNNKYYTHIVALIFSRYPIVKDRIIGKQALNKFRQDNGYKDGTYQKTWNGKEDNVTMYEIVTTTDNFDEIYSRLEEAYECTLLKS